MNFFSDTITSVGYKISKHSIKISNERREDINKVQVPNNVKDVNAFLDLVNYYGKFVENRSTIAGSLYKLLKINTVFVWDFK